MNKPIKPNITVPSGFAANGQKADFTQQKIQYGFDPLEPDVLAGDNLNKFIDDTYKSITYSNAGVADLYRSAVTYDANETYYLNSIVFNIDSSNKVSIYLSKVNNNVGNALNNNNYWEEIVLGGARNIGEIVHSVIPLTDAGLHLLDGALISGNGIYAEFVTYIAGLVNTYSNLFTTEAAWQSSVTTYGVCGKFVYDSVNNAVRLPKITGIIEGTIDANALGNLIQAGLPSISHKHDPGDMNITGSIHGPAGTEAYGAFTTIAGDSLDRGTSNWVREGWTYFDASRAWTGNTSVNTAVSSIYGNSNTVQPQTVKAFYYIVIAASAKTDIQVDIDNVATDLNGKADTSLLNINNTAKISISHNSSPSATYLSLTLPATGQTITAISDGWIFISGTQFATSGYAFLTNESNGMSMVCQPTNVNNFEIRAFMPVAKGQTVRVDYGNLYVYVFRFIYNIGSESEAS